jgi:adenosylhomocysteine nucleosidase
MRLNGTVSPTRPLLVAALPEEAAHFGLDLPVLLTGVGKVSAAIAVTRLLASGERPSEIINLGTAGALRPGLAGLHLISTVIQHDFNSPGIAALTGYTFGAPLSVGPAGGPVLATGDIFVSDPDLRLLLAAQADLVDMEGYAVASAAAAFDVPIRMVKHVSDEADAEASKNWASAVDHCARSLAAWLAES